MLLSPRSGSSAGPGSSGVRRHAGAVGTAERARTACYPQLQREVGKGPVGGRRAGKELGSRGGEGQQRANAALAERALAACRRVLLTDELPTAAAGRAAPRGLSCHPSSRSRAAPPPLPGPGSRAPAAAAAACARRRRRRRSGKMNPVCTSAHLN